MNKASSRIKRRGVKPIKPTRAKSRIKSVPRKKEILKKGGFKTNFFLIIKKYLNHLPTLILAIILWLTTVFFLREISPDSVKHFILPNSYLPFLVLIFLSSLFSLSFIFLNRRIGYLLSIAITTYLFLKIQQVVLESWLLIPLTMLLFVTFLHSFRQIFKQTSKT